MEFFGKSGDKCVNLEFKYWLAIIPEQLQKVIRAMKDPHGFKLSRTRIGETNWHLNYDGGPAGKHNLVFNDAAASSWFLHHEGDGWVRILRTQGGPERIRSTYDVEVGCDGDASNDPRCD